MSIEKRPSRERRVDRREFFEIGMRTAAALAALPGASLALAGCGSGEERRAPAVPAATRSEGQAGDSASPPRAAAPPAPSAPSGDSGESRLVTEVAAVASVVSALQYVNQSARPDQNCANCQLYTAGSGQRGKCPLFAQGLVTEAGWCVSWVARVS